MKSIMNRYYISPIGIAVVLSAIGAWACTTTDGGSSGGTSNSTSSSGTSGATTSGSTTGGGTCGVFQAPASGDACGACAIEKCCTQGKTCEGDEKCKACVARGTDAQSDAECLSNEGYAAAKDCINGPCTTACNGSSSSSGGGGTCGSVACSEGAAGDKLCADKGCGGCYFGSCTAF